MKGCTLRAACQPPITLPNRQPLISCSAWYMCYDSAASHRGSPEASCAVVEHAPGWAAGRKVCQSTAGSHATCIQKTERSWTALLGRVHNWCSLLISKQAPRHGG